MLELRAGKHFALSQRHTDFKVYSQPSHLKLSRNTSWSQARSPPWSPARSQARSPAWNTARNPIYPQAAIVCKHTLSQLHKINAMHLLHYTSNALFPSPMSHFTGKKNARLRGVSAQMIRGHNISTPFVWAQCISPICMRQNKLSQAAVFHMATWTMTIW